MKKTLNEATLSLEGVKVRHAPAGKPNQAGIHKRRQTFIESYNTVNSANETLSRKDSHIQIVTTTKELPQSWLAQNLFEITRYIENYRLQIFWFTLYTLVTLGIFIERAYYYSFEREHTGLRRIAGYGVTVTRGAASGMMFTYASLLVTMSRNTITFLRETFLHRFIPFDSAHSMHIYIAILALFFTLMHIIGHAINLYHISSQTASDLACIFREFFRATHELASFHYWAYSTITGLTGIILTVLLIVMYVFALPFARRNLFKAFWFTHNWYIWVYIFTVLHGSGRLVQSPLFHYFLLGPAVLYVLDKLMTFSRNKLEIRVVKAELLPSEVLALVFKRPLNFEYQSGQWVRVACLELGESEYHPFTLTSAPHEEHLSLHIRAVGPWTMNMRNTYNINNRELKDLPLLYLDGPFGEGHQDWYKFRVSVLVGGGIGVTPFASILKDIVHRSKLAAVRFPCQKVYFLWVSRNQKQFEWLTDIIREVEINDHKNLVAVHIFITQFQQKFDLRTTMLYICERNFQKIADKSLFTGLKATTHFGRPQFTDFFMSLKHEHPGVGQVGVFSCGPPPMTLSVQKACDEVNKIRDYPAYIHHFENF
ncbi:hypothetical protein ScPMuIL_017286 [Solemya velum]